MSTPLRISTSSRTTATRTRDIWEMTVEERVEAMWSRRLSFQQLREWTSLRPAEVPLLGGEFAWIMMHTPEWAEAGGRS